MDDKLANLSEEEYLSDEEVSRTNKPEKVVQPPPPAKAVEVEEEDSEHDDPTGLEGAAFQVRKPVLSYFSLQTNKY